MAGNTGTGEFGVRGSEVYRPDGVSSSKGPGGEKGDSRELDPSVQLSGPLLPVWRELPKERGRGEVSGKIDSGQQEESRLRSTDRQ